MLQSRSASRRPTTSSRSVGRDATAPGEAGVAGGIPWEAEGSVGAGVIVCESTLQSSPMRSLLRRVLFPILILAVAGIIALNSTSSEGKRLAIASFVEQGLRSGEWGATERFLVDRLKPLLAKESSLAVEITEGDGGPTPDGAASHVAMLQKEGKPWLGLRCRYDPDPRRLAVLGFFQP